MQATARPVLLLPLLLAWSFGAGADLVSLEYEGTITEVMDAPPKYVVGDRIAGRLLIDTQLARPRGSGGSVTYESDDPDFVRGFWQAGGDGFDRVFVGDELSRQGTDRPIDIFSVEDWLVSPNASLDGASVFGLQATLHDFLEGTSLDQGFELTSADVDEPHERLVGGFRFSNIGPFPFVSFVLDRLTVTPGVCVAPSSGG